MSKVLLIIDPQNDFCDPETGTLYVPGAEEDTNRLTEYLNKNIREFDEVIVSLDTHTPNQIFHPMWWRGGDDLKNPSPFEVITVNDVTTGKWFAQNNLQLNYSIKYVQELKKNGNKDLVIWPYHCLIGSSGHNIPQRLFEVLQKYTLERDRSVNYLIKGLNPYSEFYSIIEPEVATQLSGERNTTLIDKLSRVGEIEVAGQARSHCVLETLKSLERAKTIENVDLISKVTLLADTTSDVQSPAVDFTKITDIEIARLQELGMKVKTTV